MEPELCGCREIYLNFGCFYDSDGLTAHRKDLLALREANQAIYPEVYAHLRSARDLQSCARRVCENRDPEGLYRLVRRFFDDAPAAGNEGVGRDVFLRAWTPDGLTDHTPDVLALCPTCIALRDPFGLSAPLLERLELQFRKAGCGCIRVLSPIDPNRPEGLLVPERGLAFLNAEQGAVTVDLRRFFRAEDSAEVLLAESRTHCEAASALLAQAKALHDEMEAICRPYVRFDGVDLLTAEYKKQLRAELLRK